MPVTIRRYILTLGALLALLIALGDAFDAKRIGDIGIIYTPVDDTHAIVTDVAGRSDAARAGVRPGDRIRGGWIRGEATLLSGRAAGYRALQDVTFYDETLRRTINVRTTPLGSTFSPSRVVAHLIRILSLLFAMVLFWRFPSDRAANVLAAFLLFFNLQGFKNSGSFALPDWFAPLVAMSSQSLMWLMLVLFACWFPERYPQDVHRRIAVAAAATTAVALVVRMLSLAYAYGLAAPHLSANNFNVVFVYIEPAIFALLILWAVIVDFRTASPLDRRRLEWLAAGMALEAYSFVWLVALGPLAFSFGGAFNTFTLTISDIGTVAGTLCLLYGFLHLRVLDFSFAVNRAAVFALLSGSIVAVFVLVEYTVGKYVETYSHVTGAAITLGVALAVGLSLRAIHRQVDRFADRVIFRARYKADEALRDFGRRAAFITDSGVLRDRMLHTLEHHGGVQYASLYLENADGNFTLDTARGTKPTIEIAAHDSLVLALKDSRTSTYVDNTTSAANGEIAFPLFVRGELGGFVVCGPRARRETYSPEVVETIGTALEHAAVQLDALKTIELRSKLQRVEELLRAQQLLAADPALVLQRIAQVTGANTASVQEIPVR